MNAEPVKFNVLFWDFNHDKIEPYDVLPHFRRCYNERVEQQKTLKDEMKESEYFKVPKTFDEFKTFIKKESQYQFWSRCEYEMIVHGWPAQKNEHKLDIHEQIMMNLDLITEILFEELGQKS